MPFCGMSSKAAYWRYIIEPLSLASEDPCRNLRHLLQGICLRRTSQGQLTLSTKYEMKALQLSLDEQ